MALDTGWRRSAPTKKPQSTSLISSAAAGGATQGAASGDQMSDAWGDLLQSAMAGGVAQGAIGGPLPLEPDPYAALGGGSGGGGFGGGGAGGGGAVAPVSVDPRSNPAYLAALANLDAQESTALTGFRARQDATRRALDDLLGDIAEREKKSSERTEDSQETRGLLRSGATERLLSEVAKAAGSERARGEMSTNDQVADLERQIAEARAAAARNRSELALQYSGLPAVI